MKRCFSCKGVIDTAGRPGRGDECPSCGADVKVCLNCAFYDPASSKQCREPQAELVKDKDRANFCDFFEFGTGDVDAAGPGGQDPLKKLKDLFKG